MVTCPNGHENLENEHFCGECGVAIVPQVVICACGHTNPADHHFCGECGVAIVPQVVICACGHTNPADHHFCGECGAPLGESYQTRQAPHGKSRQGQSDDTPKAHPATNTALSPLKVGDLVQVVDRGDRYDGKIGVIKEITDEDHDYVHVAFKDHSHRPAFRRDQLKVVGSALPKPASHKSPVAAQSELHPQPKSHASTQAIRATHTGSEGRGGSSGGRGSSNPPRVVQRPKAASDKGRNWWERLPRSIQVGVVLLAILSVVGIANVLNIRTDSGRAGSGSAGSGEPRTTSYSTSDQWEAAVCTPGTFFNGANHLPNATGGGALCRSLNGVLILMGEYTSSFAVQNDLALFKGGCAYATTTGITGTIGVFLVPPVGNPQRAAAALSPLQTFGFQIQNCPGGG